MVVENAEELRETLDGDDIDQDYAGILMIDHDTVFVLFDGGEKFWQTDRETLIGMISDIGISEEDL